MGVRRPPRAPFPLGGEEITPGQRVTVRLSAPRQLAHDTISLPVHVVHGSQDGPRLFVCAGVHGDEINGVEVIRRLLERRALRDLRGTLLAVPVVNVHGFMSRSRYLPDRRDLNRSFPGLEGGSLAARLAKLFATEVVERCTHGIDLHTGSQHRTNLPQVRGDLDDPEVLRLALAFRAPVILHGRAPAGTLFDVTRPKGIPLLVFEGGEALRFDEPAIRAAVRGVLNVMRALDMLPPSRSSKSPPTYEPAVARSRKLVRAPESGMLLCSVLLGESVRRGQHLARVVDPFSSAACEVTAPADGVVIGRLLLPLVNEGDAIVHLALSRTPEQVAETVDRFGESLAQDVPLTGDGDVDAEAT
jgi:uncharacterized protein